MPEQSFADAVRESRLFFRRRLAERLAVAQMQATGGVNGSVVVERANAITVALAKLEDSEQATDPS